MDSRRLIIFEGPDGGGKSTAVAPIAMALGATTVHHGPYPNVTRDLARLYAESMLPAAQGFNTVVLDRSWLSEPIYGHAYRQSDDRVGRVNRRHLERLALRCDAVVVNCLPPWEQVLESYKRRKHLELLENEVQLKIVYDLYTRLEEFTDLPVVTYDYTKKPLHLWQLAGHSGLMDVFHHGAGSLNAKVLIVGDEFGERKNGDMLYQWPFASFTEAGCSAWLTRRLLEAGIPETQLAWVNSDELNAFLTDAGGPAGEHDFERVIALGQKAHGRLLSHNISHLVVDHPQYSKRFHHRERYELITLIKEIL